MAYVESFKNLQELLKADVRLLTQKSRVGITRIGPVSYLFLRLSEFSGDASEALEKNDAKKAAGVLNEFGFKGVSTTTKSDIEALKSSPEKEALRKKLILALREKTVSVFNEFVEYLKVAEPRARTNLLEPLREGDYPRFKKEVESFQFA